MNIIFNIDTNGKVIFFPYGITDGNRVEPCTSEEYANNKLKRKPYSEGGWSVIQSDEVPAELAEVIEGKRFDSYASANTFINNEGYLNCVEIKVSALEKAEATLSSRIDVLEENVATSDVMSEAILEGVNEI